MKENLGKYIEDKLPRNDDKELFRDLLEAYSRGGTDEVKITIQSRIVDLAGA